jgi:hypothetical protein
MVMIQKKKGVESTPASRTPTSTQILRCDSITNALSMICMIAHTPRHHNAPRHLRINLTFTHISQGCQIG